MTPAQQQAPEVQAQRRGFAERARTFDVEQVVYVDESGLAPGLRAGYGYALRGTRCRESAPLRARGRMNLIGAMASAWAVVQGYPVTVKACVFEHFVREHLVPRLEAGMVVIWDNASIHSASACRLVEQTGARVVRQPRYSPEFNGIERGWSKLKRWVRRQRVDTVEALVEAAREGAYRWQASDRWAWIQAALNTPPQ